MTTSSTELLKPTLRQSHLTSLRISQRPSPILKVTQYDRVSATMITALLALIVAAVVLYLAWISVWRPQVSGPPPDYEWIAGNWGVVDGEPDEAFPEMELPANKVRSTEAFETIVEDATSQSMQAFRLFETSPGPPASPESGYESGRPLGNELAGRHGSTRSERWFVRFADDVTLEEYARQLDYFGIELGILNIGEETMRVLSDFSDSTPRERDVTPATLDPDKMPFQWRAGDRRKADLQLLQQAGFQVSANTVVFHFYPRETQQELAQAERAYRNRPVEEIRRTWFVVRKTADGYGFQVTRQLYY